MPRMPPAVEPGRATGATRATGPGGDGPPLSATQRAWMAVFGALLDARGEGEPFPFTEAGRRMGKSPKASYDMYRRLSERGLLPPMARRPYQARAGTGEAPPSDAQRAEWARRRAIVDAVRRAFLAEGRLMELESDEYHRRLDRALGDQVGCNASAARRRRGRG